MTALATVADLAGRLGIPAPADDTPKYAQITAFLDDASEAVRDAVGCAIERATSTITLPVGPLPVAVRGRARPPSQTRFLERQLLGSQLIPLPAVPAVSVDAVLDETGPIEFELEDAHTLRVWTADTTIAVTYTHGWDPIPGELKRWTCVLAASMLQAAAAGNLGMSGGLSSVRVDDGQVSFAASNAGTGVDLPEQIRLRLRATYGPSTLEVRER